MFISGFFLTDTYVLHTSLNIWFKCIAPNCNNLTLSYDGQAVFPTNKPERKYCLPSEGRYRCGKVFMKSIEIRENA